ncbi:MAG: glycoside hydrolase family protein [Oscillospiraceae bacterium]|jgi:hypothetical protein|nr:glycoside hydrolase family protein [Oscillospiraceae bacterium]
MKQRPIIIALTLLLLAGCGKQPVSSPQGTPNTPAATDTSDKAPHLLALSPEQASDQGLLNDWAPASNLLDQQQYVGDPKNGDFGLLLPEYRVAEEQDGKHVAATVWVPGSAKSSAVINLGRRWHVTAVCLYGVNGGEMKPPALIQYGSITEGWTTAAEAAFGDWNPDGTWYIFDTDFDAAFLRLALQGSDEAALGEMAVYGYALPETEAPDEQDGLSVSGNTVGQIIGHNALINSSVEEINIGGIVREYHSWDWDYSDERYDELQFETSRMGVNFDEFYRGIQENGMDILWCLQGSAPPYDYKDIPLDPGGDAEDPMSYSAHAGRMFQYAARYGANSAIDASVLTLAPGEQPKTGLGYIKYYEGYNEPDATWLTSWPEYTFSPQQLAAMMSADYDGHAGRLGDGCGVKTADPSAVVVMPGLASIDYAYLDEMREWFRENRTDQRFAADAINVHLYTFGENGGNSPEAGGFEETLRQLADYRDAWLPGVELWITEFGWDSNAGSPLHAPAHGGYSADEVQGQWLVRGYLAAIAAGVDRAAMYMLGDYDPKDDTQFASSGMITVSGGKNVLKPSYYYVKTLQNALEGKCFSGKAKAEDGILIYTFADPDNPGKRALAIWNPAQDGGVSEHTIDIGGAATAQLVRLADGEPSGIASVPVITNGTISVEVSEAPVFVLLYD